MIAFEKKGLEYMKYPTREMTKWYGKVIAEMSANEYEWRLQEARGLIEKKKNSRSKRWNRYIAYLELWFSDTWCEGIQDYQTRYARHMLPMSINEYCI